MPDVLPTISPLAVVLLMLLLASIIGAWIWLILRLAFGDPVLPANTPRIVPWGPASVLLTVLCWIALQYAVPTIYQLRQVFHHQPPGTPRLKLDPRRDDDPLGAPEHLDPGSGPGRSASDLGGSAPRLRPGPPRPARSRALGARRLPAAGPARLRDHDRLGPLLGQDEPPARKRDRSRIRSPGMVAILVLAGVVLAPAAEELIFRGVLLGWLTQVSPRREAAHPGRFNDRDGRKDRVAPEGGKASSRNGGSRRSGTPAR